MNLQVLLTSLPFILHLTPYTIYMYIFDHSLIEAGLTKGFICIKFILLLYTICM